MVIKSTSRSFERKKIELIKQNAKNLHNCPLCGERIEIGIEKGVLSKVSEDGNYLFPHIHLHGNPLHAILCYVDRHSVVRGVGYVRSIEISRDSDTFQQFIKKWSNPY
ncbi:hypothetical protein ES707_12114 [subsurface metagenome]